MQTLRHLERSHISIDLDCLEEQRNINKLAVKLHRALEKSQRFECAYVLALYFSRDNSVGSIAKAIFTFELDMMQVCDCKKTMKRTATSLTYDVHHSQYNMRTVCHEVPYKYTALKK